MTTEAIPTYQERLGEISRELSERSSIGLVVVDLSPMEAIEEEYGAEAYHDVRARILSLLAEQRGKDYRNEDVVGLDQPRGVRVLIFLAHKRRRSQAAMMADVKLVASRIGHSLLPSVARAAFPYLKNAHGLEVGWGVAVHNPLVHVDRTLRRAFWDALEVAAHHRQTERLQVRERLLDILLRERVVTAFQPIVKLADKTVMAFEALTRPPRGAGLEGADGLFGAAKEHNLLVELDRLCRRRALLSSGRIPSNAKIFVNTLPATIRDPQFRGKALIDFLDKAQVAPDRIVIEITEHLVIENYALFRETMAYFTALGMSFAVDDVGAGYSGLESIARLKPAFLKIDHVLVRDLHASLVNREMVKAIVALGAGIGARVVAEGIQTEQELQAVQDLGAEFGQGYLLARPDPGPEPA